MNILKWSSKLKTILEKYRIAFQESKVIVVTLVNLEDQMAATVQTANYGKPSWMIGFPDLKDLILKKQLQARDSEIKRLSETIRSFELIHKSLNALLKDVSARVKLQSSLKSISPLEILEWIQESFYSISREIQVQKNMFENYVMGLISIQVMAERWDAGVNIDFGLDAELKKRLKYFK